jgi:DNA-directed RNA polymerase subunit RPC12/RpoP
MKQIVCEACGSKDLVKQDGIFVCQHCDTKYSTDDEKKNPNADAIFDGFNIIFKDAAGNSKNINISDSRTNINIDDKNPKFDATFNSFDAIFEDPANEIKKTKTSETHTNVNIGEKNPKFDAMFDKFDTIFKDSANELKKTKTSETRMSSDIEKSFGINKESSWTKKEENRFISWGFLTFLSFFLGWLGADRFYVGKKVSGVIKLLIFLFFFISYLASAPYYVLAGHSILALLVCLAWWLLDLVSIIKGEFAGFRKSD